MPQLRLRTATADDRIELAELICVSTNFWYQRRGGGPIFPGGPESTEIFVDVYEALDPGCCVVAENPATGRLMGSCFYHPRAWHVSLGIMNVHPNYFRKGVASALLKYIVQYAADHGLSAVRLVQSALNLDSFSLYNRAGFVPRYAYQDMLVEVPASGFAHRAAGQEHVRPATLADVPAMHALERELSGISREKDFHFFLENRHGIWQSLVIEGERGAIDGFLVSSKHPASNMVGPGVMRSPEEAAPLIAATLDRYRGGAAVCLVPMAQHGLVQQMYAWGARNCELHLCQVRGDYQQFRGVNLPTFLPESA